MKDKAIAVIDLKAFYAYVECIDRGLDPWTAPLIVADKERGKNTIILSVSPYLKSKGVPSRLRVRDLPNGFDYIYATPRMARYIEKSTEVISIMLDFFSEKDIHVYSIDEAFIDLTSYLTYYKKTPLEIVKMVMESIKERTGLQATGGIGDNLFLSKVALDIFAKKEKDGIGIMHYSDVPTKLWPITPLSKIWGIGPATEAHLKSLGINTVYELAHADKQKIEKEFGIMGDQLIQHANGIDESDMHELYVPKETSLTNGQTLFRDFQINEARTLVKEMTEELAEKLRLQEQTTSVVSIFIGYTSNLGGFHHQQSLLKPSNDIEELVSVALAIFDKYKRNIPVRNISINFGKLEDYKDYEQLDLFIDEESMEKKRNLQDLIAVLHQKYGKNIIVKANALTEESTIMERHNQIGGHRK